MPSMIVFSSVTKKFADHVVVDSVTFTIQPGEFVCLTGPSGAGKSTIVHLLIRAELPTSGTIEVDGADLATLPRSILQMYRRKTGVLFRAGDPDALAEACLRLVRDPDLTARLIEQARAFVRQERTWRTVCEGNVALYRELLG